MCDCIYTVNAKFEATHNVHICATMPVSVEKGLGPPKVLLKTERADGKRGKTPPVCATFCPFCGERYVEKEK
ncbi:MAG: hypothetical protein HN742_10825 [Lentisphaerae bacterium]|jgi:hypothetical protein|nr:hypothetical protein [Lentisphaerota bacterium]MBT7056699.1 hypothetical protein [Lentisphaerota bacterium]MBT7842357.1 hypothetical protein [Lentisphaerota bacterium]